MALLLLLLLAAVASTTADQLHVPLAEHVEPAVGISAEQYLPAVKATIDEPDKMAPHVDEPEPAPEPDDGRRTYIIELEPPGGGRQDTVHDDDAARAWHKTFLPSATTSSQGNPTLLHSYRKVFTGFAARLTEEELKEVSAKPGFLHSQEQTIWTLDTTHTPAFLGLPNRMGEAPDNWPGNGGRAVVIGVIDHGIDIILYFTHFNPSYLNSRPN
jgi:hypothetical protein